MEKHRQFIFTSICVRNSQKHELVLSFTKFSIIFLRDIFFHGLFIKTCLSTAHCNLSCKYFGMNTVFTFSLRNSIIGSKRLKIYLIVLWYHHFKFIS